MNKALGRAYRTTRTRAREGKGKRNLGGISPAPASYQSRGRQKGRGRLPGGRPKAFKKAEKLKKEEMRTIG